MADSLVDARGQINLTSADGRKLFDLVKNAESDFAATSQAMKDSGASAGEINSKLTEMRAQFVDTAQKMGFTKTQAELMANAYGMILVMCRRWSHRTWHRDTKGGITRRANSQLAQRLYFSYCQYRSRQELNY